MQATHRASALPQRHPRSGDRASALSGQVPELGVARLPIGPLIEEVAPTDHSARGARPGDLQPADRLLHIAHASGERAPDRYLCGAPVRQLIARIQLGTGPRGGAVCATCAQLHAARADGRERDNRAREDQDCESHDHP
jgi:hypothetical protein